MFRVVRWSSDVTAAWARMAVQGSADVTPHCPPVTGLGGAALVVNVIVMEQKRSFRGLKVKDNRVIPKKVDEMFLVHERAHTHAHPPTHTHPHSPTRVGEELVFYAELATKGISRQVSHPCIHTHHSRHARRLNISTQMDGGITWNPEGNESLAFHTGRSR